MLSFFRSLRLRRTAAELRQSSAPPRGVAPGDPLTRWSERLAGGWPGRSFLPQICVGLEGCASAFNAMNSIRTCMHFGTALPPFFLSLTRAEDIRCLHPRSAAPGAGSVLPRVALFGEDAFLRGGSCRHLPLVALENYTCRAESILASRVLSAARLVVGHENNGVSRKYLDGVDKADGIEKTDYCAERVVYVPQYGTISSLNVVTSMGIALFYAVLDGRYPSSRTVLGTAERRAVAAGGGGDIEALWAYQDCFRRQLPTKSADCGPLRVDERPIHPLYYRKDVASILEQHQRLRQLMLRICARGRFSIPGRFGLSVIYENERDQRSLGGIVRSANAFLVDHVFYIGRKKVNVVGTIGTQHYTPPVYLGSFGGDGNGEEGGREAAAWTAKLHQRIEELSGAPVDWWFLDCGHAFLYADGAEADDALNKEGGEEKVQAKRPNASLVWYNAHRHDPDVTLSLCDAEERLRGAVAGAVLLLVPQEGILPPFHLLQRCTKILSLLPTDDNAAPTAGLPVSVAAGIALQRLSAVMHPEVVAF